ncbi:MAG TPA: cytochrome c3 family protein [Acidobacteriota bacterium]|nr:cytochrome c3 family protein [Acidobacteriota bacterium]
MSRLIKIAIIAALCAALAGAGAVYSLDPYPVDQPIAFSHRLHVEDLGADCTDCHLYASTGIRATIPNVETCSVCHLEPLGESAAELKLAEFVKADQAIPWAKVYWVPEDVFFSHRLHSAIGGIECQTCHGPVAARDEPLARPLVPISMESCIDCHQEKEVPNDCIACHR